MCVTCEQALIVCVRERGRERKRESVGAERHRCELVCVCVCVREREGEVRFTHAPTAMPSWREGYKRIIYCA